MATFVQLTDVLTRGPLWVNLDRVKTMRRLAAVDDDYQGLAPERTELHFGFGDAGDSESAIVTEMPAEILQILAYCNRVVAVGPS